MRRTIALAGGLVILSASFFCAASPRAGQKQAAVATSPKWTQTEPLSYDNVVKFFRETLKERPLKVHQRCAVFFEGEYTNSNIYSHSVIIVENSDEDFEITFYISDDRGMFWVSEFIDTGFFNRDETQSLFRLVHGTAGNRTTRVGRFRVELTRAEPHHAKIIVFSFTAGRSRG